MLKEYPCGTAGFEKPQDCVVTVKLKESGGITIRLHSKLEHMFGSQMIQSAEESLRDLSIVHAEVEITDFGSLDFVIKARVKTAVRRALSYQKEGRCFA